MMERELPAGSPPPQSRALPHAQHIHRLPLDAQNLLREPRGQIRRTGASGPHVDQRRTAALGQIA